MNLKTALYVLRLTVPKVIFCNEKSAHVILKAIKEENCDPIVVIFGNFPNVISFNDILSNYTDSEVMNFRYIEVDDIKNTVCILHSSGTTGLPKAVELSNYSWLLVTEKNFLNITDSTLWFSPLYWYTGIMMNLITILQGYKVIIYPEFNEEMTCILIEKYKVTYMFLGTSLLNRLLKADCITNFSLSSLQNILCGGSNLNSQAQNKLRRILPYINVRQCYGMTEVGIITYHHSQKSGSCGTIIQNVQMKIMNLNNKETLVPNQSGEIWIKAETFMNGYYKNFEATKDAIDEEGWFHTGDLGYIDEDGELYIIDRLKELIKYRGYQVSPGEIETLLQSHSGLSEVAVVAVPHEVDDEHPIAFVIKKPGVQVTKQELIDLVANNMMNHYQLRAGVIFLDAFPYTASGKISKKELKAIARKLTTK